MTAVWRSGAEIAPHTIDTEFVGGHLVNASQDGTIYRSGSFSLKFSGSGYNFTPPGINATGVALRAYILLGSVPGSASSLLGCTNSGGGSWFASLKLRTDRKLELWLNGFPPTVLVATSAFAMPIGSFECLELWVDRSTNIVATRYNGTEWARASVTFAAVGNIDTAFFGPVEASAGNIYYDDLAINSLAGPDNNGWCGPSAGGVLTFRPSGTASLTGWTFGGAPTAHECLDDVAPDDFGSIIRQADGTFGASAQFYFPTWPVSVPASCAMIGLRASSGIPTDLSITWADAQGVVSAFEHRTLGGGFKSFFPMLTAERAWDATRRLLNNGYSTPSTGGRHQVIIARGDSVVEIQDVTTLWMTVDFPLALAAAPVPLDAHPTALAEIITV